MNAKYCRKFGKFSYSSVDSGEWKCPTCRADLSDLPHYPAGRVDNSESRRKILNLYETGGITGASSRSYGRA